MHKLENWRITCSPGPDILGSITKNTVLPYLKNWTVFVLFCFDEEWNIQILGYLKKSNAYLWHYNY